MPISLFLVSSYPCLKDVVSLIEERLPGGGQVIVVVFRRDLERFFRPIEKLGVHLDVITDELGMHLRDGLNLWRFRRDLRRTFVDLWGELAGADVFCYDTSISAALIASVAFLTKRNTVHYCPDFEGRYVETSFFQQPCRSPRRCARNLLCSWVLRAPVELCRDWSPVAVLSESFLTKHVKKRGRNAAQNLDGIVAKCLQVSEDADVLWLYTDHPRFYGYSDSDAAAFYSSLSHIVDSVINARPNAVHAVKGHPSYGEPYPACFSGMHKIPAGIPSEFISFSKIRLVLGDATLAMVDFLQKKDITVVSLVELLANPPTNQDELRHYLAERNTAGRTPLVPTSLSELNTVCRQKPLGLRGL